MDLDAMLDKCVREQWKVGDLDWSGQPREMSRDDEIAIVQYFTDMAGIERLAAALFAEQRKNADDAKLRKIFESFVRDEIRHAHAAQMLADFYDVHRYQPYRPNPALTKFTPHFVNAVRYLAPEIANAYITGGELVLDVALLRSINDYVGDEMSEKAMELINRDESRHIAIDFHMVGHYASEEYLARSKSRTRRPVRERVKGALALAGLLYYAAPFFKSVFFEPMSRVDPSGKRIKEAFKRMQILGTKSGVREHPFSRFMIGLQDLYNDHPVARVLFGRLIQRVVGIDDSLLYRLYDEMDRQRAERMSFDELAEDALGAKYAA
jgi:hypothetical protein